MHEELIQKFKKGNRQAGDDYYKANKGLIKLAIYRYKPEVLEYEEAVALVNQAFAYSMNTFDSTKGSFSTWFMRSAHGHIMRYCRDFNNTIRPSRKDYMKNKKVVYCDSLDRVTNIGDSRDITIMDCIGAEDDNSGVFTNELLKVLNKKDKNIFILYHLNGFSQQMIAENYGMLQVAVSRNLTKSRQILKINLKEVS